MNAADRLVSTGSLPPNDADGSRHRAALIRLHLDVLECPQTDATRILTREIAVALRLLEAGDCEYARQLVLASQPTVTKLRRRGVFGERAAGSTIEPVLAGLLLYSAFVLLVLGPCVVVVASLAANTDNGFTQFATWLGLMPIFQTVQALGAKPQAYLWGLLGGAGAVVSLVKRFDQISSKGAPFWLLFSTGLFSPIVGSLSAVVVCNFIYATDQLKALQIIPNIVVAFFAGFSERLLVRVEAMLGEGSPGTTKESREAEAAQQGAAPDKPPG